MVTQQHPSQVQGPPPRGPRKSRRRRLTISAVAVLAVVVTVFGLLGFLGAFSGPQQLEDYVVPSLNALRSSSEACRTNVLNAVNDQADKDALSMTTLDTMTVATVNVVQFRGDIAAANVTGDSANLAVSALMACHPQMAHDYSVFEANWNNVAGLPVSTNFQLDTQFGTYTGGHLKSLLQVLSAPRLLTFLRTGQGRSIAAPFADKFYPTGS